MRRTLGPLRGEALQVRRLDQHAEALAAVLLEHERVVLVHELVGGGHRHEAVNAASVCVGRCSAASTSSSIPRSSNCFSVAPDALRVPDVLLEVETAQRDVGAHPRVEQRELRRPTRPAPGPASVTSRSRARPCASACGAVLGDERGVERQVEHASSARPAPARSRARSANRGPASVGRHPTGAGRRRRACRGPPAARPAGRSTSSGWSGRPRGPIATAASNSAVPMPVPAVRRPDAEVDVGGVGVVLQRHVHRGVAEHAVGVRGVVRRRRARRPSAACGRTAGRASTRGSPCAVRSKSRLPHASSRTSFIAAVYPCSSHASGASTVVGDRHLTDRPRRHGVHHPPVLASRREPFSPPSLLSRDGVAGDRRMGRLAAGHRLAHAGTGAALPRAEPGRGRDRHGLQHDRRHLAVRRDERRHRRHRRLLAGPAAARAARRAGLRRPRGARPTTPSCSTSSTSTPPTSPASTRRSPPPTPRRPPRSSSSAATSWSAPSSSAPPAPGSAASTSTT